MEALTLLRVKLPPNLPSENEISLRLIPRPFCLLACVLGTVSIWHRKQRTVLQSKQQLRRFHFY